MLEFVAKLIKQSEAGFGGLELGEAVEGLDDDAFGFIEGCLFFEVIFGGLGEVEEEALMLELVVEDNLEDEGDVMDVGAEVWGEVVEDGMQVLEGVGVLLGEKVSISGAIMAGEAEFVADLGLVFFEFLEHIGEEAEGLEPVFLLEVGIQFVIIGEDKDDAFGLGLLFGEEGGEEAVVLEVGEKEFGKESPADSEDTSADDEIVEWLVFLEVWESVE